jgi:hypothetical protein
MIFVLADDNVLHVANSEVELQGAFEGIDVEEGTYRFFDETGIPLAAKFVKPNIRGKLFGMFGWVSSGTYRLNAAQPGGLRLIDILSSVAGLEENSHFSSLDEVKEFLTSRSRRTP